MSELDPFYTGFTWGFIVGAFVASAIWAVIITKMLNELERRLLRLLEVLRS